MNVFKARQDAINEAETFVDNHFNSDFTHGFKEYIDNVWLPKYHAEQKEKLELERANTKFSMTFNCNACKKEQRWEFGVKDKNNDWYCSADCALKANKVIPIMTDQSEYTCDTCGKDATWHQGIIDHDNSLYYCSKKCMQVDVKKELDTLHNELNTLVQTYVIESRQRDIALSKIWEAFDLLYQVVK